MVKDGCAVNTPLSGFILPTFQVMSSLNYSLVSPLSCDMLRQGQLTGNFNGSSRLFSSKESSYNCQQLS
jgi:hypothetical protein